MPFAYPPLQFYFYALLLDLGGDPVTVSRLLPSVGVVAALVPTYLLGRDAADSRPAGTAAAALVALNPQILEWHLSAGGVVRAFAFLYATTSIYAGYRVFVHDGGGGRRAVALGAVAFDRQMAAYETVSTCQRAECVESVAADVGERPTHVYVPKGQYTIRGENAAQFGTIERSFERSDRWERAYENDGVVIYRTTDTDGSKVDTTAS